MATVRKILVTTDFSEFSLASVDYARSLASSYGAGIWLLHVVDYSPIIHLRRVEKSAEAVMQNAVEKAEVRLRDLARSAFPTHEKVRSVVRRGDPCSEIVRFAREEGMDMIVMATHGRTGISHVLLGSVAEKVVRYSTVPVLSVKPKPIRAIAIAPEDIQEQLHLDAGRATARLKRAGKKRI